MKKLLLITSLVISALANASSLDLSGSLNFKGEPIELKETFRFDSSKRRSKWYGNCDSNEPIQLVEIHMALEEETDADILVNATIKVNNETVTKSIIKAAWEQEAVLNVSNDSQESTLNLRIVPHKN